MSTRFATRKCQTPTSHFNLTGFSRQGQASTSSLPPLPVKPPTRLALHICKSGGAHHPPIRHRWVRPFNYFFGFSRSYPSFEDSFVDFVSKAIVHLGNQTQAKQLVFHLGDPDPVDTSKVFGDLAQLGYPTERIPWEEWVAL
ncbi:hypothetical protein EJ03DRAFT_351107 [Teratosphaeria nubilosa]|uniref:Uncharacterized protein n=1 Tax=Teratosphaeria nubilosa TaxID=161662 RepID=A0A6G1L9J2_9PEZI|nr:hypothetical protein EJ03DRAFT_351107 [Teratosphaeria nubilosa]